MIKITTNITTILLLISSILYSKQSNDFKEKMDNYTQKTKMQWEFNPLKNYETDRQQQILAR